ncbi:MAG: hypothetical protein M3362_21985, partial [Acidobacteriota bacterium]|nr:hypothetical protein [Acidobacteriota bacterium]
MEQSEIPPRLCDFHRFRRVASGNKRQQGDTIGAFGVGSISVYQVTDQPEIFSGIRHWIVTPQQGGGRIKEQLISPYKGTRFFLPWANVPDTEIRAALAVPHIEPAQLEGITEELNATLPLSIPFLKHLGKVTLRRNGRVIQKSKIVKTEQGIKIHDGTSGTSWHLIQTSFQAKGEQL